MDRAKTVATLVARPGKADALRDLLLGMLVPSRAEPGNLGYELWQNSADPNSFVLDELYVDAAAVAAHRASPHFQHYLANIGDLAERSALALTPIDIG